MVKVVFNFFILAFVKSGKPRDEENMKRLIVQIAFAALLTASGFTLAAAQTLSPEKTVKVKIYLSDTFESENLLESLDMVEVEREVDAKSPLRSALEAQLAGATNEEENTLRLFSPVNGISLISVQVKNKIAYAKFTRTTDGTFSKTDALRFRKAVSLTARQFPSVKKIEICLDGIKDFWLVSARTHQKCD